METISDEILMQQVAAGNLDQLTPLFQRYKQRIYNYFLKMTFDAEVSEDLVQNVFMRIIKYNKSYKPDFPFKSWIYRVARNVFNDHYQRRTVKDDMVELEQIPDDVLSKEEGDAQHEKEKVLMKAISKLAPDKRELLIWSKFQGMKYEEIAKTRNTSVGAIKVQVHRAMGQLKEIYFQYEN